MGHAIAAPAIGTLYIVEWDGRISRPALKTSIGYRLSLLVINLNVRVF